MAHRVVWGLDIGNSAIKAVKMVRSGTEARIVDFDIIDIQAGDDEANRPARIQAALNTLCNNHSFGRDAVYLSLSGDMCLFREFQLPPGSESKLGDLVLYEAKQQIPFPLDQVELGWEKYDDPTGAGVGVEMIVVRKNIIADFLTLTDTSKLNVQGITVSPVALFNFIKYEYQPTGATLLLDAGYKSTDFVVMNGRHMYSRTIQIAGREITRVLENKFKVSYDKAEELKKNLESNKQKEKILGVIEPTLRQLGAEIQRTIGFYKSKARGQKVVQGYLLGHTFRLPRMAETMASQVREAPFTVVDNVKRIVIDRAVNPGVFANEFPTMAVAIGLGLQGLGLSELTVNLLPKERVTTNRMEKMYVPAVAAAAAILICLGVGYYRASKDLQTQKELERQIADATHDSEDFRKKVAEAIAPLPAAKAQVEKLSRIGRDRGRLTQIYAKIAGLKDAEGKALWGDASKIYLTNLFLSRMPFTTEGSLQAASIELNGDRSKQVTGSRNLTGTDGFYAFLGKLREVRNDLPLVVVISGESPDLATIDKVREILKGMPEIGEEIKNNSIERLENKSAKEAIANLDWFGELRKDQPVYGTPLEHRYTAFHLLFRWRPQDDKDLEIAQAPAAPPAKPK